MRVRFQADVDLDGRILRGLRRAAPEIDIRTAPGAGLAGLEDPEVLRIAADSGRILVIQDRRTMPGHFARFSDAVQSPRPALCEYIHRIVVVALQCIRAEILNGFPFRNSPLQFHP